MYEKLIDLLIQSITEPNTTMIIGGTYKTPVIEGLQPKDYLEQLQLSNSYSEASFDREFLSRWGGDSQNAFFSADKFDRLRILQAPEYEYSARSSKKAFYVLGIDVGRLSDQTEIVIVKSTPQVQGVDIKSVVNICSLANMDFEEQAICIKRLYYKYKAQMCVIDAMGMGIGLVDFMIKTQIDPESGEELYPFGVSGGTSEDALTPYKHIKGGNVNANAMYLVKATAPINTEAFTYTQAQILNGKIKFLIDEAQAKANFLSTARGQKASIDERVNYLLPYEMTSILKMQMMNLVSENEGVNIILKRDNSQIKKDKFSALVYSLLYIKREEERRRRSKKFDISQMMFFT